MLRGQSLDRDSSSGGPAAPQIPTVPCSTAVIDGPVSGPLDAPQREKAALKERISRPR